MPHAGDAEKPSRVALSSLLSFVWPGSQPKEMVHAEEAEVPLAVKERAELRKALQAIHTRVTLWDTGEAGVFLLPVDVRIAPNYYLLVKTPVDLSLIGQRIADDEYSSGWQYLEDMWLMFDNCFFFNKPGSFHNRYATRLKNVWSPWAERLMTRTLSHHNYCCGDRRYLSGVSYRCRGGTCFIKYGSQYWYYPLDNDEDLVFCQTHYQKLAAEVTIPRYGNGTGGDVKFYKADLTRAKHNTPLVQERFVHCDVCNRKDHEVCVLYNAHLGVPYRCRRCAGSDPHGVTMDAVEALPLSEVAKVIQQEVHEVEGYGESVVIRTMNHSQEVCETKPKLQARFPDAQSKFPYSRKVILAFTPIDGRPVCFFGCIVHEYGADCDDPNHLRIYISLLDSVKLPNHVLPSAQRTALYHCVLRGYLRFCGSRGFTDAHIYTCPPRRGQNYIFPFKPDEQREISVTRLRQWYASMLSDAMFRADPAVAGFMNIQEAYDSPSLPDIPYFDGDNWPDILEDIIKLDEKAEEEERKKAELRKMIDVEQAKAWEEGPHLRTRCRKPKDAGGYYEGQKPPKSAAGNRPRKKRKMKEPKKKLTLDGRLGLVLASSHRDFLVVKLMKSPAAAAAGDEYVPDPDAGGTFASTGEEHSLVSFFQAEKLEFSSVRHMKFSTMMLLHLLHSKDKQMDARFPKQEKTNGIVHEDMAADEPDQPIAGQDLPGDGAQASSEATATEGAAPMDEKADTASVS